MPGERRALLIATDVYSDPGLTSLRAPTGDVRAFAEVLADRSIGDFDVQQLVNKPTEELKQEIERFFDEAALRDLLLLYISGHGILSHGGGLFFATASTKLRFLRATAIEDRFVNDVMLHCRARSIVVVLDCCHSGAFPAGLTPKGGFAVDVDKRFQGRGHITLTASTAMEYAFERMEGDASVSKLGSSTPGSLFTRYVVEGLQTGNADLDNDGLVTLDELYDYVYDRVRERSPQTPGKSGSGHGDIVIARRAQPPASGVEEPSTAAAPGAQPHWAASSPPATEATPIMARLKPLVEEENSPSAETAAVPTHAKPPRKGRLASPRAMAVWGKPAARLLHSATFVVSALAAVALFGWLLWPHGTSVRTTVRILKTGVTQSRIPDCGYPARFRLRAVIETNRAKDVSYHWEPKRAISGMALGTVSFSRAGRRTITATGVERRPAVVKGGTFRFVIDSPVHQESKLPYTVGCAT